jgi:hypothetical protein
MKELMLMLLFFIVSEVSAWEYDYSDIDSPSKINGIVLGSEYEDFRYIVRSNLDRPPVVDEFYRYRGEKYRCVVVTFMDIRIVNHNPNAPLDDSSSSFMSPYYIVFDGEDRLSYMGYRYEFKRSSDTFERELFEYLYSQIYGEGG